MVWPFQYFWFLCFMISHDFTLFWRFGSQINSIHETGQRRGNMPSTHRFTTWLGEFHLGFNIILKDLMASTSMSTFGCPTFNVVLSMNPWRAEMRYGALLGTWILMSWFDTVFHPVLLGIPRRMTSIFLEWSSMSCDIPWSPPQACPARYRGSNFLRQRLVLSTVSGRPVVITDIRVKANHIASQGHQWPGFKASQMWQFWPVFLLNPPIFGGLFPTWPRSGWRTWFKGLRGAGGP